MDFPAALPNDPSRFLPERACQGTAGKTVIISPSPYIPGSCFVSHINSRLRCDPRHCFIDPRGQVPASGHVF